MSLNLLRSLPASLNDPRENLLIPATLAGAPFRSNKIAGVVVNRIQHGGNEPMRDPFTAGLLSFLIPGVGQLYNGRILAGILWLIITPGFWIGSGGTLGWICHIIAAYTAYSYAKDHPVRVQRV